MAYRKGNEKDKESHRLYMKEWYRKNKKKHLALVAVQKRKKKEWFRELKSSLECIKCGEDHPATIDFHHKDPKKKGISVFQMMHRNLSKTRILEEIDKCEPLCSNCHRKHHWEEQH